MFNFFCFRDEDKHLDFTFPLQSLDSYHCFVRGMNTKNWLGRSIYLIASVSGFAPYILPMSRLFEAFLISKEKEVETEEELSSFFAHESVTDEGEIFDAEGEKVEAELSEENEGAELKDHDAVLARQLQEEEYDTGSLFKEDVEVARELQEKEAQDLSKKDEAFARQLQDTWNGDTAAKPKFTDASLYMKEFEGDQAV